ncbi:hypothetical protein KP509_11G074000 [Ceratopteris richardii]|nr:hypothetical protein KP509_11G074000 [Ceratopteris richardii]
MDGIFVNLYNVELSRTQLRLKQEVIDAVPPSYDPIALGSFVEKYGTHIITGVRIGGKDVICIKQDNSSSLSPTAVQKYLEVKSKERFSSAGNTSQENTNKGKSGLHQALQIDSSINSSTTESNGLTLISRRKGGQLSSGSHDKWLHTVSSDPSIVSMSFVSIASLLSRVPGSGFLTQAINLYLRYKPPIQELDQFLEFQLPKEWAPAYGHLPLAPPRKQQASPSLQFRPLGPKLQVNTTPVVLGKQCVTGMRLHLEGRKRNVLAIHLQHLKAVPQRLERMWKDDQPEIWEGPGVDFMKYFEPVMWKSFSHVCTAPIESIDAWDEGESRYALIVTGVQLEVEEHGSKKVLFLRLLYSKVHGVSIRRSEWDYTATSNSKSGIFSTLIAFSGALTTPPKPQMVNINSGICPKDPPTNSQTPKLLKLVDTSEMARGPVHSPGHWIVTGAKLSVDSGKICVHVKYSLLSHVID